MERLGSDSSSSVPASPNPAFVSSPLKLKYSAFSDETQGTSNGESTPTTSGAMTPSGLNLGRKESYKMQRQNYRFEKKKAAKELLSTLKDPTIIVLADWLKVRGTLKSWTKLWCILKPGLLLLYKSNKAKSNHWVGTILLSTCKLIERPSKKDGFCFKLYHPLDQSIWAPKGPQGETIPAVVQPLPTSHLIFRVSSQEDGKCWMDALELSLRCSTLLMRSMVTRGSMTAVKGSTSSSSGSGNTALANTSIQSDASVSELQWNESDNERHFKDQDFDDASHTDENDTIDTEHQSVSGLDVGDFRISRKSRSNHQNRDQNCESDSEDDDLQPLEDSTPVQTVYVEQQEEEFGSCGEQVEELADGNKSLIWLLVKQVRPGMDLSRVVLPTFILEPRSFLDKLSDYYYHADLLSRAVLEDDPFTRMKTVVQWYLSGFYKKPKGLKKPYNPILGERFRCCWKHPNGSTTFYIAEQVSHHPPVSALYVTNRKDGFTLSASILAKSKFYGNSLSALLDGSACLTLLPRGEDYIITMPYAHCKGILLGTLTMELGGEVFLKCEKTGYRADLEFKLKPMIGGADNINFVTGKLRLGKETLATISGYWDDCITFEDKRTGEKQILWNPTPEIRSQRLKRHTVAFEHQQDCESEKLWLKVSLAIQQENQELATTEKTVLEEAQRAAAKERAFQNETWIPHCFELDPITGTWQYRHADVRPWDPRNDVFQYENNFVIATKTRHRTPMIRAPSIVSVERQSGSLRHLANSESRNRLRSPRDSISIPTSGSAPEFSNRLLPRGSAAGLSGTSHRRNVGGSVSSSAEGDPLHSSEEESRPVTDPRSRASTAIVQRLEETHRESQDKLNKIHNNLQSLILQLQKQNQPKPVKLPSRDLYVLVLLLGLFQVVIFWIFKSETGQ